MTLQAQETSQRPPVTIAGVAEQNADPVDLGGAASAKGCAQLIALGLALLADARDWMAAQSPQFRAPVEAMAFSCAAVSPWRTPAELAPCVRTCVWIFAFDDYIERSELTQLDDMLHRCANIVGGQGPDHSHWLLTALSGWQQDLVSRPLYPALAGLWAEKFESMLRGMRYEWLAGRNTQRDISGVTSYLAHADSVAACMTHLPRWLTYGDSAVLDHLDLLVSALGDYVVAVRLANDLASFSRDHDEPGNDNILMYGVSPDWVKGEIARRAEAAAQRLADLIAARVISAVELMRELEYATTFYSMADFRGWGSDAN
jgi:hypothetical protein